MLSYQKLTQRKKIYMHKFLLKALKIDIFVRFDAQNMLMTSRVVHVDDITCSKSPKCLDTQSVFAVITLKFKQVFPWRNVSKKPRENGKQCRP